MPDELYERLKNMYLEAGWIRLERSSIAAIDGYPEKTRVRFYSQ